MQLTHKASRGSPLRGSPLRGLLTTRKGAFFVAFLCAVAAALVLVFALGQYRQGLKTANRQDTVLVASALIQKGTSGDAVASEQLFRATPVIATRLPSGAISDAGSLRGTVAARDILPGQQLTTADFAAGGGGIAAQLAPNQRAISVALDTAHGMTDVITAGDRVDVYGSFAVQYDNVAHPVQVVRVLIPGALVLKTPGAAGGGLASSGTQGGNVVLEVADDVAPNLAYAADNGKVWLVLAPGSAAAPNQDLTTIDTLMLGIHVKAGFKSIFSLSGGH